MESKASANMLTAMSPCWIDLQGFKACGGNQMMCLANLVKQDDLSIPGRRSDKMMFAQL